MKTRIISGIAMFPLLAVLYFGGVWIQLAGLFVAIIGLKEFYNGFLILNIKPSYNIGILSAVSLYLINFLFKGSGNLGIYMPWLFFSVLLSLLYLFNIDNRKIEDAMVTVMGIVYVVFFSFHIVLIDQSGESKILIWLSIFSAFGTDICAYFVGVFLGKHKLCPKISPKKSIEGSIGGIIGSSILCGIFGFFFAKQYMIHCMIIGVFGSVFSQFGDLTASIFKRKMGIKDYGTLIPGHGGILDRFDSVIFTAPLVFYYIYFVIGSRG